MLSSIYTGHAVLYENLRRARERREREQYDSSVKNTIILESQGQTNVFVNCNNININICRNYYEVIEDDEEYNDKIEPLFILK